MNNLIDTLRYFFTITVELTVLFLCISTVVALVLMYIPRQKLGSWLSRRGLWGYCLGAAMGAITPFCACSTIPVTLGLLNAGAPFGPVMSFVIASPLLNPIIIGIVATLMGIKACIVYLGVTFFGSIFFGLMMVRIGGEDYVKKTRIKTACCSSAAAVLPKLFVDKLKAAFKTAWSDFRSVITYIIVGVGIGSIIYGYVPEDMVVRIAGPQNPFAIPVAAIIGIPLYIRAESAIPIGLALSQKGMSMGAVIALVIGGSGMAIPEMSMLAGIFKLRLVSFIVAAVFLTAVIGGFVFNIVFGHA